MKNKNTIKINNKKQHNKTKKIVKGGAIISDTLVQTYVNKVYEILNPNGKFTTIFRGLYHLIYLNNNNLDKTENLSVKEKVVELNLRLFCWIRDNVPGSMVVIPKNSIFSIKWME